MNMIRIRSKEYAETILHFQQCLMTLKGKYIKNQLGDFNPPWKYNFQLLFFSNLSALRVNGESAKRRKSIRREQSWLKIEPQLKNLDPLFLF